MTIDANGLLLSLCVQKFLHTAIEYAKSKGWKDKHFRAHVVENFQFCPLLSTAPWKTNPHLLRFTSHLPPHSQTSHTFVGVHHAWSRPGPPLHYSTCTWYRSKINNCPKLFSGCNDGQALVPDSILMSSRKRNRLGPDKCNDGNLDTVCTTKSEPYPTITLDFGRPVEIAEVNYYQI